MKKSLALLFILTAFPALAAEEADPAMAALKRMRDQLRTIMLQQQKTEAERAALAAEKVTLEEKVSTLDANLKKLAKESNLQKETDTKAIADLQDKAAKQAAEIVRLQESLAAWKKGHAEVVDAAKKIDAQRAEHAARAILAERKLADANRKNLDLYNIGHEILAKYEGFGLGTAIIAREPFTRNMKVKLENYLQDFGDKLQDGKIQPADATKPAATKEQAAAVLKPVQQ
ncbi:MAG: hypothetical protein ACK5TH_08550 [Prosthecobacter sp.]